MDFEPGPIWLIRWSFSYSFLFKCWVAELYLGGQWFHYTNQGNSHSSKIIKAKLAKGKCSLSHWRSHQRNTDKMSPQTQWLQDYRNLISHFINWVLSVEMANNEDSEASIHWKYTELSRRLFNNLLSVFSQVVEVGLERLSDWLKRILFRWFLKQSTFRELNLLLWIIFTLMLWKLHFFYSTQANQVNL